MDELHENEQYFFDEQTIEELGGFLSTFDSICCICTPLLGAHLAELGTSVAVLDIDERFRDTTGFMKYDLTEPQWLGQEFDLIICDPPFFNVSLSQLFHTLRMLSQNSFEQSLMVSYLKRREEAILSAFAKFGLTPSGYAPGYQTVEECAKNRVEFYTNLPPEEYSKLTTDEN